MASKRNVARFMSFLIPILITIHVIVCILLVFLILMQRPRSEGLGAAFGGGMTENIFGAQTTNILSKATVWLGALFFIIALLLAILFAKQGRGETAVQKELLSQTAPPAASAVASPAASASEETAATPPLADDEAPLSTSETIAETDVSEEVPAGTPETSTEAVQIQVDESAAEIESETVETVSPTEAPAAPTEEAAPDAAAQ